MQTTAAPPFSLPKNSSLITHRSSLKKPVWLIKMTEREHWPTLVFYAPMLGIWLFYVLKMRSLAWFTAINRGFGTGFGGFYGESKKAILDKIPAEFKPKTALVSPENEPISQLFDGWKFPLIAKPDVGERGNGVEKIESEAQFFEYWKKADGPFIVQEFVDFPLELAVFWSRSPKKGEKGRVSSVTKKEFLAVEGDGKRTLEDLVFEKNRARLVADSLKKMHENDWSRVLAAGEKKLLEPIGNHCRGTRFVAANELIDARFEAVFETIASQIDGFDYGRFDLRTTSLADLLALKNIRIVELNGVSSDPAHVYDGEKTGFFEAYRSLFWHWRRVAKIAQTNIRQGQKPASARKVWQNFRARNL